MALLWLQFGVCTVIILVAAQFLAQSADTVAARTGLGRTFVGVVMLATATSLPELATGISSITLFDAPDLAIGDAFGSNLFNLLIIGLADLYWRHGPILTQVTQTTTLVAASGAGLIVLASAAIYIYSATSTTAGWYVSPISVLLLVVFGAAMWLIYRHDQQMPESEATASDEAEGSGQSLRRALVIYALSAAVVVAAAIWLADSGERIAEQMHWEESFVGAQFLAISTSLPELGTTFAALRLHAPDLAISNLLGSNVFNMGLILFLDDLSYSAGTVWAGVSTLHIVSGLIAVLMTMVVIAGMMSRPRSQRFQRWAPESAALLGCYGAASALLYLLA